MEKLQAEMASKNLHYNDIYGTGHIHLKKKTKKKQVYALLIILKSV